MSRNKYLVVTPFFPSPTDWRGAYVLDQVKAIKRNSDFDVIIFKTSTLTYKESSYEIEGITVNCIHPLLMPSYILNGLTEKLIGDLFAHSLSKYHIDVNDVKFVHCHTTNHSAFGFGIKKLNPSVKVLVQLHDLDPLTLRNGKWADKRWNRRYRARKSINALNNADLLICISEPVKDALLAFPMARSGEVYENALGVFNVLQDLPHIQPRNLYILNNGVDTSVFNKSNTIHRSNVYRIGCIANFQELKDHITLVKAFNILIKKGYHYMRLSMLGSGETKEEITRYIENNDLQEFVEWPEEIQHNKLPDYYRTLDIFALPSRYEGFGCVYTEAAACGVPFICCENQGAAECIKAEERHKWLIKDRDSAQLAGLIEDHYNNRYDQILVKTYDIDTLIENYLEYLSIVF